MLQLGQHLENSTQSVSLTKYLAVKSNRLISVIGSQMISIVLRVHVDVEELRVTNEDLCLKARPTVHCTSLKF